MTIQLHFQNPLILGVHAAHERIPNHMVRPIAPTLDDGTNIKHMIWSADFLYEWNIN